MSDASRRELLKIDVPDQVTPVTLNRRQTAYAFVAKHPPGLPGQTQVIQLRSS